MEYSPGEARDFCYPTVTPVHFHTVFLFHGVPVARFKNTTGFYLSTPTPEQGGYSPGIYPFAGADWGQTGGKAIIV